MDSSFGSKVVVDPHFSHPSSLVDKTRFFICEKLVLEKSKSPLILFYFKRKIK